jgi:hypothetical protein
VRSLVDLQEQFAHAMTSGDGAALRESLAGGREPRTRLAIHLRHYVVSLTAALCDKYPAVVWLVGASVVCDAARAYARSHPPSQPCIAEYGGDFPEFIGRHSRAAHLPYLAAFASLEWAVGRVSIATDAPALSWAEIARKGGAERLIDSVVTPQPGLRYLRMPWRVDELMQAYLGGAAPARFVLLESATSIEVRGARGAVRFARLGAAEFAFRTALAARQTIGDAAEAALELDAAFDTGVALRELVAGNLVIGISAAAHGQQQ